MAASSARTPWTFHFTPTWTSWLNAVEGFISTITRLKIRRGVFKSVADLKDAIERYIKQHNKTPKRRSRLGFFEFPFPGTADGFDCWQRPVRGAIA